MTEVRTVYIRKKRMTQYPKAGRYDCYVYDDKVDAINAPSFEVSPELMKAQIVVVGDVEETHKLVERFPT